jgi:SAM-dependent methyltransferase
LAEDSAREAAKLLVPVRVRRWLRSQQKGWKVWPPVGKVKFGSLSRVEPISKEFGFDRGHCIDRFYIENFLAEHALDIRGRVLEVADNDYTKQFGGQKVTESEVLHLKPDSPNATIVADLVDAPQIPADSFDCIILTQTLQFIFDTRSAIRTILRILKPGGVLLATVPGISQVSRYDMERWGDYWRFTSVAIQRLFAECFSESNLSVRAHGNVFAAVSLLHGLAQEDIDTTKLHYSDPDYEVIITIRASKHSAI